MFRIILKNPNQVTKTFLLNAWKLTITDVNKWVRTHLINALVYGGFGIQGIAETPFYKWATSPEGLSELGIPDTEPPKLLDSYKNKSFKINTNLYSLELFFGDRIQLKLDTPHPFTGVKKLKIDSWMTWIFDGVKVVDAGFVSRNEIANANPRLQKYIRLKSPLGGLMLPKNALKLSSIGKWSVPQQFVEFDTKWLIDNIDKIENALWNYTISAFKKAII